MSPSQPQNQEALANDATAVPLETVQNAQPKAPEPMDPQQPHATTMDLRGGDRGELCPGRFCFCIPCPLPCDFCII